MINWLANKIAASLQHRGIYVSSERGKEEWVATVHNGQLCLARGSFLYLLGDCQEIVDKVYECPMLERVSQ